MDEAVFSRRATGHATQPLRASCKKNKKQTNKQTQKLFVKTSKEFPFSKRIGHQRRGPFIHPPFIIELDVHISLSMTTDKETLGIEESH